MSHTCPPGPSLPPIANRPFAAPGYLDVLTLIAVLCLRRPRRPTVVTVIVVVLVFVTLLVAAGVSPYAAVPVTLAGAMAALRIHRRVQG